MNRYSKPLPGTTRTYVGTDGIVHVENSRLGLHLHVGDNQPAQQRKLRDWLDLDEEEGPRNSNSNYRTTPD